MRDKILIVDDSKFNRHLLKSILEDEFGIIEAENGRVALEILEEKVKSIAAVLLDIVMPEVDGVTFLKHISEKEYMGDFPVLVVTGEQSMNLVAECFDYGISDFIRKPINTAFVKQRVHKLVGLYMQKNDFKKRMQDQILTLRNQYKLLLQQEEQLKANNEKIIDVLGTVVEYRHLEGKSHIRMVKEFTRILAEHVKNDYPEYELTNDQIQSISSASALHDIGKVLIPDSILLKAGKLTEEEQEYMKSHSLRGYEIINSIADAWDESYVRYGREITRWHHERYDGEGYPDGLTGEEIPIAAQIVSLADSYASLISESVYKSAKDPDEAYNMIIQGECGTFSYKLLECFRKARTELERQAEIIGG